MVGYGQQSTRETAFFSLGKKIEAFGMVIRNTTYSMLGRRVDKIWRICVCIALAMSIHDSLSMEGALLCSPSHVIQMDFPDSHVRGRFRTY